MSQELDAALEMAGQFRGIVIDCGEALPAGAGALMALRNVMNQCWSCGEALDVDPADAAAPQEKTLGGCFHRECRPGPVDSLKAQAAVTDFVMGDS